jgi:hypothetical protein
MTSLCRRLASNGLFRLSMNRHGEGKFRSGGSRRKKVPNDRAQKYHFQQGYLRLFPGNMLPHITGPQKINGVVLQGRPHAHAAVQLTDHLTVARSKGRREG